MPVAATLGFVSAAFAASALGGALGMASGIFIVPLLILVFGTNFHTAVAVSLVSVIACSCGSAAPFLEERLTNLRLAVVLETATTSGALTGVFLIGIVPATALYVLFAVILLLSARQMLARRETATGRVGADGSWATRLRLHSTAPAAAGGPDISYEVGNVPLGLALMYAAGLVSALLGIGSGVLKIPAMDTALRLPIKVSSATSNFMIGVTAAASAGAYFIRGDIDPQIAGPVALGSVLGALAGARFLVRFSSDKLRLLFAAVLVLLAAQMLYSALAQARA